MGSDARVVISLTNTSDHQILFAHRPGINNPEFSYKIEVRNAAGRVVEETAYGREAQQRRDTKAAQWTMCSLECRWHRWRTWRSW